MLYATIAVADSNTLHDGYNKNKYKRLNEEELTEMFQTTDRKIVEKNANNLGQDVYLRKTGADSSKVVRRSSSCIKSVVIRNCIMIFE